MPRLFLSLLLLSASREARADEPEEVRVRASRNEVGETKLAASDVREMPGAFGDAFRAIEALPGVTPMVSGLPYFYVRGAPPSNSGYFIDGIRIPLLFHLALGPSVIHPALIDRVDFYPGAAPASYGGYAGAIIAGETREPSPVFRGAANLRLIDAGALIESPFAEGRGSALAAGRYGFPGPVISLLSDTRLGYWDYQSRVRWRLDERNSIGIFVFGSHDFLGHLDSNPHGGRQPTGRTIEDFVSDFHRIDLRFDHALRDGNVRAGLTFGYDSQGASPDYLDNRSIAGRLELDKRVAPGLRIRAGADARIEAYAFHEGALPDPNMPAVPSSVSPAPTNVTADLHADVVWRVAPRVEIVPGARMTMFGSSRASAATTVPAFDPRLATRVTLTRNVTAVSTVGIANQLPTLRVGSLPSAVLTGPGFPLGTSRLQTVAQASQGVEVLLPAEISLTATGFLAGFSGLTDLSGNCIQIAPAVDPRPVGQRIPDPMNQVPFTCPNDKAVHGRSYGVELLLRRSLTKRLTGWLSYTLSRSVREQHFITPSAGDAVATVPSDFDRTYVLNVVGAYEVGWHWRLGGRFMFYSGAPYSPLAGNVSVPPYNSLRDPPFYRVDVRIEKRWLMSDNGFIAFVIEGQNVTLSTEMSGLGTDCIGPSDNDNSAKCKRATVGPITLPSIGLEAIF